MRFTVQLAQGHPINLVEITSDETTAYPHMIEDLYTQKTSAVIVKNIFSQAELEPIVKQLHSSQCDALWQSPNEGMPGGALRTIGEAATPSFTAFTGPTRDTYLNNSQQWEEIQSVILQHTSCRPQQRLSTIFSQLFDHKPAQAPLFIDADSSTHDHQASWLPFNYRMLTTHTQIYSHHDQHYKLPIYKHMSHEYDRSTILSWFVVLQPALSGGLLKLYGLWGSDPDLPMLPTRFIDTEAVEQKYHQATLNLVAGDLVIFDSGHHVHRVSAVEQQQARITLGGFMTLSQTRDRLAFWS